MRLKEEYRLKVDTSTTLRRKIAAAMKMSERQVDRWANENSIQLCDDPCLKVLAAEFNVGKMELIDFSETPSLDPKNKTEKSAA